MRHITVDVLYLPLAAYLAIAPERLKIQVSRCLMSYAQWKHRGFQCNEIHTLLLSVHTTVTHTLSRHIIKKIHTTVMYKNLKDKIKDEKWVRTMKLSLIKIIKK